MQIQTICRGLLLALIALASLLPPPAWAGWANATPNLTATATPRAFDRTTKQIFSYVTVENDTKTTIPPDGETLEGPFRLVITSSKAISEK